MTTFPPELLEAVRASSYPLVFATVSGAHLYGFPSPDSDWDLRGMHVLPLRTLLGLHDPDDQTVELLGPDGAIELDLVTHDARKFMRLLRKRNGYVLEQVLSPHVVHTTPEHDELCDIARRCVTHHHAHHYLGFARSQWRLARKDSPPRVKPLLYVVRVLLTGIHLMRTGDVLCDLPTLLTSRDLPEIADLVARKRAGSETVTMTASDLDRHETLVARLTAELEEARDASSLPATVDCDRELDDLLWRLRGSPSATSGSGRSTRSQ